MTSNRIAHITTQPDWRAAQTQGEYRAASLETQGFIHCSTPEQVLRVANAFYRDASNLVLLWIAPERVQAEIKWEPPDMSDPHAGELFPHIYGPLNVDAVTGASDFSPWADGSFRELPSPQ